MTTEVRRCSHCNEPAVIVVRRWGTSQLFGLVKSATVSRTDYRCQACGASFRVLPWHGVRTVLGGAIFLQLVGLFVFLVVCGAMLLTSDPGVGMALTLAATVGTVVFGVGFLWAVSSSWYVIRNPIVPDAPVPALRYGERDLSRRCTCGGVAPVHRVGA